MSDKICSWAVFFEDKPNQNDLDYIADLIKQGFTSGNIDKK